jgi:integrating conjugative element protein (TIGR03765 family)
MPRRLLATAFFAASAGLSPAAVVAQVLYEGPDSRPVEGLYGEPTPLPQVQETPPRALAGPPGTPLPLIPRQLTVGREPPRPLPDAAGQPRPPLRRPLFLIGADPDSFAWLDRHAEALDQLGALGLIVQAATPAEVDGLRRRAPGVSMIVAAGDDVAVQLGIRHYPVVIGPGSIRPVP